MPDRPRRDGTVLFPTTSPFEVAVVLLALTYTDSCCLDDLRVAGLSVTTHLPGLQTVYGTVASREVADVLRSIRGVVQLRVKADEPTAPVA